MGATAALDQRMSGRIERPNDEKEISSRAIGSGVDKLLLASLRRLKTGSRPALP
jgi:hypothetical protein